MSSKRRIIPVFVPHLGCPNDCVFCNQKRISGQTGAQTAETVTEIIETALRLDAGAEYELAFYGGSFTAIPPESQEELLGAVLPFLRSGKISSIRLSTRPDCIDEEVLKRLKAFGVTTVELGVQSMCEDVLIASGRGHTAEDAVNAAEKLHKHGFNIILQMMTGLPQDAPEKSLYTARELIKLKPNGVRVYPTVIIADTALYDSWKDGTYTEHTVEAAVEICARIADEFEAAGIPIIRMGLNPTDELSSGAAVAGAYHPAFGELVMSRRYLEKMRTLLSPHYSAESVLVGVSKGQVSAAVGQKRGNIRTLENELRIKELKIRESDVKKGDLVILSVAK